ncbi:glycosyltransferase [Methylobacillus flagellatus]|uniref:glycosyltransferase n=1 Tax=Methylobacillus flagellatus TaxID=405 RepID=UPI0010FA3A33|nr:glycosyltransferase [Methylobacillus flagellatus]
MRTILVVSHAHPDFSKGGGEVAAYNAYNGFREAYPDCDVRFLAAVNSGVLPGKIVQYRENEYLLGGCVEDPRLLRNGHTQVLAASIKDFFNNYEPELVNFHHYFNIGTDAIIHMRRILPKAQFVMTLHEFLAICMNDGQMIKRGSTSLCKEANEFLCGKCFPEHELSFFAKRKNTFMSIFALFDKFISPSDFLRDRYVAWGLPLEKFAVIENGQADAKHALVADSGVETSTVDIFADDREDIDASSHFPATFGYFGQINPYKGLDILLMALQQLVRDEYTDLVVEINGANIETQAGEFRDRIKKLADPLLEAGVLRWNGPYERTELEVRMRRADWLVIPSIWWENSPMIIQEAYIHKLPVIASSIGGMAEKVKHGVTGIHVTPGAVTEWADILRKASKAKNLHHRLKSGIELPPDCKQMALDYMAFCNSTPETVSTN